MQNPWFKPGTAQSHIDMYTHDQDFHRRVLGMSMSGRRLMQAFGEYYDKIWWDNANPLPVDKPDGRQKPNVHHMISVICRKEPMLVVTIGGQAYEGMQQIDVMEHELRMPHYIRMHIHHPNARGRTQAELTAFATKVIAYIQEYDAKRSSGS